MGNPPSEPRCARNASPTPQSGPLWWRLPHTTICPRHHILLTRTCPTCRKPFHFNQTPALAADLAHCDNNFTGGGLTATTCRHPLHRPPDHHRHPRSPRRRLRHRHIPHRLPRQPLRTRSAPHPTSASPESPPTNPGPRRSSPTPTATTPRRPDCRPRPPPTCEPELNYSPKPPPSSPHPTSTPQPTTSLSTAHHPRLPGRPPLLDRQPHPTHPHPLPAHRQSPCTPQTHLPPDRPPPTTADDPSIRDPPMPPAHPLRRALRRLLRRPRHHRTHLHRPLLRLPNTWNHQLGRRRTRHRHQCRRRQNRSP